MLTTKYNTIDLKPKTRIIVAMSGGVDSSVAACLLKEAGYDVIGITLQLYSEILNNNKKTCCAGRDIIDAKHVAKKMNFPHYVLDYENYFKSSVINNFINEYIQGKTPIPCIRCNEKIKFQNLLKTAYDLGATAMATGHYIKRINGINKNELHKAKDRNKDQSYFLFTTTQKQLDFLRFPLGNFKKSEIRYQAKRFGLNIAEKQDSQDICFVQNKKYNHIIYKNTKQKNLTGKITNIKGKILGYHKGITNFTIGQRKGLKITTGEILYVININANKNIIKVGPRQMLACEKIIITDINWLGDKKLKLGKKLYITIQIRSTSKEIPAIIYFKNYIQIEIIFKNIQYGVSKGQACVLYYKKRVLGGGWIHKTKLLQNKKYE